MAIARGADRADLAVLGSAEETRGARRHYLRRWLPIGIGLLLAAGMIVVAAAAPLIAPLSPSAQFLDAVLKAPGSVERHVLVTDEFPRDIPSQISFGARISLECWLDSLLFAFWLGL